MKVLFFMGHVGYIRNFESTLRLLAQRGHTVHLAFDGGERLGEGRLARTLAAEHRGLSYGPAPRRGDRAWLHLARTVRFFVDYLRYLDPRYEQAPKLRGRAAIPLPSHLVQAATALERLRAHRRVMAGLLRLEDAIPVGDEVRDYLRAVAPDVVLVTPLVQAGSDQVDYIKAARGLGIPTGLCVYSWDNLTNKGLIRVIPDLVTVWNAAQRAEAIELHGVPPARVIVTGAAAYDHWFEWRPHTSREPFCRTVGLAPERPFLLYLCSSTFIAPREAAFVAQWLRQIRASPDPRLREAGVLVRPHPQNGEQWRQADLGEFGNVAVWPRGGANPIDSEAKAEYYDSIHHSAGVVGINTSALIEAGIVGRPVYTLLAPEFADTQEGTLHFHYLRHVNGGLLRVAKDWDEHLNQLAHAVRGAEDEEAVGRGFIREFVRPHGLEVPATPLLADAIEELGRQRVAPARTPLWAYPARGVLYPVALGARAAWHGSQARRRGERPLAVAGRRAVVRLRRAAAVAVTRVVRARPLRRLADRYVVPRLDPFGLGSEAAAATKGAVDRLGQGQNAVIVGPWLGEIGFELLYWVPFLRWAKAHGGLAEDRLVVVSRGGASSWYRGIAHHYRDVFDHVHPEQFRIRNAQRASRAGLKQLDVGEFDGEIIREVRGTVPSDRVDLLHPSLMYRLFLPYWIRRATGALIDAFTEYRPLGPLPLGELAAVLPDRYVAVKFYFNDAFPDTDENRRVAATLLRALSERIDVVLLNTGLRPDDHQEWKGAGGKGVHTIEHLVTPSRNLDVQTRIIGQAQAFVGTYGGFSYLAPFCGVTAVALYSEPSGFLRHHLELAGRVFATLGTASLVALHVRDVDAVGIVLGHGGWG